VNLKFEKPFCLWFTGLSGAGKSTVSHAVYERLQAMGLSQVELLDGDVVRTHLTKGLGFSKEDRDTNVLRIGWVCQLLVRHGAAAITAAISPYRDTRDQVRAMVEAAGGPGSFVEVHVDASVEVCARRDVKGLYAKAISGDIPQFTGVSDPYEAPTHAEIVLHTESEALDESTGRVLDYLQQHGFVGRAP
jgi:adenylylsulfate kinase